MPSDADLQAARDEVTAALVEKGATVANARAVADAAARNAERRRDGLPTTSRTIPTDLLRRR